MKIVWEWRLLNCCTGNIQQYAQRCFLVHCPHTQYKPYTYTYMPYTYIHTPYTHPLTQVSAIFGSSLEVMISVHGESPHQGAMFRCGDAFATIVSVDAAGDPVDVPFELEPSNEAERACMQVCVRGGGGLLDKQTNMACAD